MRIFVRGLPWFTLSNQDLNVEESWRVNPLERCSSWDFLEE